VWVYRLAEWAWPWFLLGELSIHLALATVLVIAVRRS
jgi:hypothetical protein